MPFTATIDVSKEGTMSAERTKYFWQDDDPLWYKDAIVYELHVRAFYDTNADGVGDFPGLTSRLDYLRDLGVTAVWLLPFYPSPLRDDGYDISDYTKIHPAYGTLKDFRAFIRAADERGLRVITELVVNHTSDQHPWFRRARQAPPGSRHRDFYVWSDDPRKYREARIIFKDFERSNWTYDYEARSYYWHRFYSHQPDLNFDSPMVRNAVVRLMSFWLNMGVSGLRLDAVPYLYERDGTTCENLPETHAFLRELRREVDRRFKNRMLLAEANQWAEDTAAYFGQGDECHMAYHFPLMPRMFMAIRMEDRFPIVDILQQTPQIPDTCQWGIFLRNHDELTLEMVTDEERDFMYRVYAHERQARINLGIRRRLAPLLNNDRKKMELMKALSFSLPGTPIVYYGDEIGMGDNFYLGDRNGVRTPMQWNSDRNAGFSTANPQKLYLPVNIDPEYHYETINVEAQQNNPDSFLWWMKRIIALRRRYRAFGRGSIDFLYPENRKILAFIRKYEGETLLVVANLSRHAQHAYLNLGAAMAGVVPVELFGRAEFPPITEGPYPLSLGPYAFYWFSLEAKQQKVEESLKAAEATAAALVVRRGPEDLLKRTYRPRFEAALIRYLRRARWFGGKSRRIRAGTIAEAIPLPFDGSQAFLVVLRVEYTEGEPELYLMPVAFATGERVGQLSADPLHPVIATVELRGAAQAGAVVAYDALASPEFRQALVDGIGRRRTYRGLQGNVMAYRTRGVYTRTRGPMSETMESTLLRAEQSNSSITYGDRFVLKLYRRLEDGTSPELEIGRFLTDGVAFANAPNVAGALEYRTSAESEPVTFAVLHTYVRNEGNAWTYTLDALGRYYDNVLARPGVSAPLPVAKTPVQVSQESPPPLVTELIAPYLESVRVLGQRTAELHLALASAVDDAAFAPEPFSIVYQRALFHGHRAFMVQVMNSLKSIQRSLQPPAQEEAARVLERNDAILARFQSVTRRRISAMRIRCHGDYHLGQVLHTGGDFVIIDFEGEPARSLGERRIKHSPLKDVAGMLRSFHYAAHLALHGQTSTVVRGEDIPVLEQWARAWYLWVSAAFLRSYLDLMSDTPVLPSAAEDVAAMLDGYLLQKALYEIQYEMNNRPDWLIVPLRGIMQVLESGV
jgi:maltose alpha-D-glucosyltransferase/alpha-amylase